MINNKDNPVEWALLVSELDEAKEHLEELTEEMAKNGTIDEEQYRVQLGHVYAHLNRCWHSRSLKGEIKEEKWEAYSSFPKDVKPVG